MDTEGRKEEKRPRSCASRFHDGSFQDLSNARFCERCVPWSRRYGTNRRPKSSRTSLEQIKRRLESEVRENMWQLEKIPQAERTLRDRSFLRAFSLDTKQTRVLRYVNRERERIRYRMRETIKMIYLARHRGKDRRRRRPPAWSSANRSTASWYLATHRTSRFNESLIRDSIVRIDARVSENDEEHVKPGSYRE